MPQYQVKGKIAVDFQAQTGKALSIWGDAGWGGLVREGKYHDNFYSDALVKACVAMMHTWNPEPAPTWVTCVPSLRHPDLVPDVAKRLAEALNLPFQMVLAKTDHRPEQKTMANSTQQARNIDGSLAVIVPKLPEGAVLLVDEKRMQSLLGRGFLLSQVVEHWQTRAIWVLSRADAAYPRRIKTRLREGAPAVLYGCGDIKLLETGGLAVVGSRHVDQAAMRGALEAGGKVSGVLADRLEKTAMNREHHNLLIDGQLVPLYVRSSGVPSKGLEALRSKGALPWPEPQSSDAFDAVFDTPDPHLETGSSPEKLEKESETEQSLALFKDFQDIEQY